MNTFHLEILSPERQFYRGECLSLVIPISDGLIGIMANHSPLTAAIQDGELTFTKPSGEKTVCAVTNGMVDVSDNVVKVLCESVILPEEIDEEKERRSKDEALLQLKNKQGHKDYVLSKLALAKAVNNLRVKQHSKGKNTNL